MAEKAKKRERGANYTAEEKQMLMELIRMHYDIVENKKTTGNIVKQKREAWNDITIKYNHVCTTGARDADQLKTLYENIKQKCRRANSNNTSNVQMNTSATDNLWTSKMNDGGTPMLEVNPLPNKDNYKTEPGSESECDALDVLSLSASLVETQVTEPPEPPKPCGLVLCNNTGYTDPSSAKKVKKPATAETLKRIYFKKKIENAQLEHNKLLQEIAHLKKEHNLKMLILKLKLEKASSQ